MKIHRKLKQLLTKSEHKQALLLIYMMIVSMVLETMGLGLVMTSIAMMTQPNLLKSYPAVEPWLKYYNFTSQTKLIVTGVLALVVIYFAKTVFIILMNWKRNKFIFGVQANLSHRLFKGYIEQPWAFHLKRNSAQLIHNAMNEVCTFTTVTLQSGLILLTEGLVLLGVSIALLIIEPVGTTIILGFVAMIVLVFHRLIRDRLSQWGALRQKHDEYRLQHLQQGLGGAKDAKILGRESNFIRQFNNQNVASFNISRKLGTLTEVPRLILELLVVISLACMVIPMLAQGKSIEMLIPTIGLFTAAAFRLIPSVNRILGAMQNLRSSSPSISRLHEEITLMTDDIIPLKHEKVTFNSEMVLNHVSYKYADANHCALDDISLTITQGASVGIIGKSGSGKSTLIDNILGLLTPQIGTISVDRVDIQSKLRGWQDKIGYVPQTIFLTDDTLRRNVAFGLSDAEIDNESIQKAIKAAHLDDYINSLSGGLDTFVGERGVRLSGGQRQRVGIARALYHNPEILVLDEATSSLDSTIENEIMKDIYALQGEKTLIIVAHRMSTVRSCNWVYRLEHGKIVDSGCFMDVINRNNTQWDQENESQAILTETTSDIPCVL